MPTPENTLVTEATLPLKTATPTVVPATGRVALAVPGGGTIEAGYTGVMDITSLALGLKAGKVELWRMGDIATLNFINVEPVAASGNWLIFDDLPIGFRTVSVAGGEAGLIGQGSTGYRRTNWTKNGDVAVIGVALGDILNGSISITAKTWPAALIGASTSTVGWV